MTTSYKQNLRNIKTFIFDVDGVFTDGVVWLMANGEQVRTANVKDGYAVQLAVKKGFRIAVISGGNSEAVRLRFQGLGVKDIFLSSHDKWVIFEKYVKENNLNPEEILYMGDDIVDYRVLKAVGVSTCPQDAAEEIRDICDYTSPHAGGKGCVRDVIEQTLKVQGLWMDAEAHQW